MRVARSAKKEHRRFWAVSDQFHHQKPWCPVLVFALCKHNSTLSLRGFSCCLRVQEHPPAPHWCLGGSGKALVTLTRHRGHWLLLCLLCPLSGGGVTWGSAVMQRQLRLTQQPLPACPLPACPLPVCPLSQTLAPVGFGLSVCPFLQDLRFLTEMQRS